MGKIIMLKTLPLVVLCVVLGRGTPAADAAAATPLKANERIVFFGDSITVQGSEPNGFLRTIYAQLQTKYKDLHVDVVNAGVASNQITHLQRRVESDVIARKPTLVVIYIGINDVYAFPEPNKEGFATGLKEVIAKIEKSGARVILCTPSVINEKKPGTNAKDSGLDAIAAISRTIAKERKLVLCDLRQAFVSYETAHNPQDLEKGILTVDGIHLTPLGNQLVAEELMKALGM